MNPETIKIAKELARLVRRLGTVEADLRYRIYRLDEQLNNRLDAVERSIDDHNLDT